MTAPRQGRLALALVAGVIALLALCAPAFADNPSAYAQVSGSPFSTGDPTALTSPEGLAFSPSGGVLVSVNTDSTLSVFSVGSKGVLSLTATPSDSWGDPVDVAFSPSGTLLATADTTSSGSGGVSLWSVAGGTLTYLSSATVGLTGTDCGVEDCSPDQPTHVAFSPDGTHIATIDASGRVTMFSVGAHNSLSYIGDYSETNLPAGEASGGDSLAFSPYGDAIAVGTLAGDLLVFSVNANGSLSQTAQENPGAGSITGVAWSPFGASIAAAVGTGNQVDSYSVGSGNSISGPSETFAFQHQDPTMDAFNSSGTLLAATESGDSDVELFSVASDGGLSSIGILDESPIGGMAIAFSSTGMLATADQGSNEISVFAPVAPSCHGPAATTNQSTAVAVSLSCSDPGGLPETYAVQSQPAHGTLGAINQSTGTVTFTPTAGYSGYDSFTYTATTLTGTSQTQTATVDVVGAPTVSTNFVFYGTYYLGQPWPTTFSCADSTDGPGISSCTDSNGASSPHGQLNTATVGTHTYTVTAVSLDGQSTTKNMPYTVFGLPTATISSPAGGGIYNIGQTVATSFSCADATGAPGITSCTDSNGANSPSGQLNTATAGTHTYTVTATSQDDGTSSTPITYAVVGPPTAIVTTPASGGYYALGQQVPASFSCADDANAAGISSCDAYNDGSNNDGNSWSGPINTETAGQHTFEVEALSQDGQYSYTSVSYWVVFPPSATITGVVDGGTYTLGQSVTATWGCADARYAPGISQCTDSYADLSNQATLKTDTVGTHTYTVTAVSQDGQSNATTVSYDVERPSGTISSPSDNGTYTLGQQVPTSFNCADAPNGPGISSCTDSNAQTSGSGQLDTATVGAHTYTVNAVSRTGAASTQSIAYTVIGPPSATITAPTSGQVFLQGQSASSSFSCTDASGGPGISSCTDASGHSSPHAALDTQALGAHTYTMTAQSQDGETDVKHVDYMVVAPPGATIQSPADGGSYLQGQQVPTSFSCADSANAPGISSCADSEGNSSPTGQLDTQTPGTRTYTVTAQSQDGGTTSTHITYRVIGSPSAVITAPSDGGSYNLGQHVPTSFACTDDVNGPGISSCTDTGGSSAPHGQLDTSTAGTFTYTVTADSSDGKTATAHVTYTVIAPPSAHLQDPADGRSYTLGQTVSTTFACDEAANGPGVSSCIDSAGDSSPHAQLDTAQAGTFTYTVTATSQDGQSSTDHISYTVIGPPTVSIADPAPDGFYALSQTVATRFACAEADNGPGIASCADSAGASAPGGRLDTQALGQHTYTVTATSQDREAATGSIAYMVVAPPSAAIQSPASGGSYAVGEKVPTAFSCTEASQAPGLSACTDSAGASAPGGQLDTQTLGQHTYTVTATSQDGQTQSASITYSVLTGPSAAIQSPADDGTYIVGQQVATRFSCADSAGAPGLASCTDVSGANAPGGQLDTQALGQHSYTVTATSQDGQTQSAGITYTVVAAAKVSPLSAPASAATLFSSGEPVGVSCQQACTAQVDLVVYERALQRGTARLAHTHIRGRQSWQKVVVGHASVHLGTGGSRQVTVTINPQMRRILRHAGAFSLGAIITSAPTSVSKRWATVPAATGKRHHR